MKALLAQLKAERETFLKDMNDHAESAKEKGKVLQAQIYETVVNDDWQSQVENILAKEIDRYQVALENKTDMAAELLAKARARQNFARQRRLSVKSFELTWAATRELVDKSEHADEK